MTEFEPAVVSLVKRHYDDKGYMTVSTIRDIPAVIYDGRFRDAVPQGFHKYEVRGTDWSECDDADELLSLCEQHRKSLGNHLNEEEYEQYKKSVLKDGDDSDDFFELRSALNAALEDDGAPQIEGFEETLREAVLVNFWTTVFIKEDIADIRRELGLIETEDIDVETGYCEEENCEVWKEFIANAKS